MADDAGDMGTAGGTDTTCVSAEGALCVRNVLPPAQNHSEVAQAGRESFPRTPRIKLDACCPSAWGHPCGPTTAHSLLPIPKELCADFVHPVAGACSISTLWVPLPAGALGKGRALKRPFPCCNNAGHFAWCHLHSSCFGWSPEPSRALFPWHLFNGQDENRP